MIRKKKTIIIGCLLFSGLLGLFSCGSPSSDLRQEIVEEAENGGEEETEDKAGAKETGAGETGAESDLKLVYENSMELQYAEIRKYQRVWKREPWY